MQTLKTELARRQEDFIHTQELQNLTIQEESAASRLSYERLLSDKRVVDIRIDEIEVSPTCACTIRSVQSTDGGSDTQLDNLETFYNKNPEVHRQGFHFVA